MSCCLCVVVWRWVGCENAWEELGRAGARLSQSAAQLVARQDGSIDQEAMLTDREMTPLRVQAAEGAREQAPSRNRALRGLAAGALSIDRSIDRSVRMMPNKADNSREGGGGSKPALLLLLLTTFGYFSSAASRRLEEELPSMGRRFSFRSFRFVGYWFDWMLRVVWSGLAFVSEQEQQQPFWWSGCVVEARILRPI